MDIQGATPDRLDDIADRAERALGVDHKAWDMVDRRELVRAVLAASAEPVDIDEAAAVGFYVRYPSAALLDFDKRMGRGQTVGVEMMLRDSVAVHAAMLRGEIAKPALRDMLHVYGGEVLARWDAAEASTAPAGFKLVPVLATDEMMRHFSGAKWCDLNVGARTRARAAYAAMLSAAPASPDPKMVGRDEVAAKPIFPSRTFGTF